MITIATIYIDFVYKCVKWFLIYLVNFGGPYVIITIIYGVIGAKVQFRTIIIADKGLKTSIFLYIISLHLTNLALLALDHVFNFCFNLNRAHFIVDQLTYVHLVIVIVFVIVCMDSELLYVVLRRIIERLYNDYI